MIKRHAHEKTQPELVTNSKFFHKRYASIPRHLNLTKQKKYHKVTKQNSKAYSTNTKKPKRNKYAKKGLFENCSKTNQY